MLKTISLLLTATVFGLPAFAQNTQPPAADQQ
jgi:hypothetical protein